MKKDIPIYKVEDSAIAIVPKENIEDDLWEVYYLNLKKDPIRNLLINSKGYGELNGENIKTSTLRHYFEEVTANTAVLVEAIQTKLFDIANEYWVSFQYNDFLYDKKYVFVKGSITQDLFTPIPLLGRKGIMIK